MRPGGHLLVLSHAAPPPWSPEATPSTIFPTLAEDLAAIGASALGLEVLEARIVMRPGRGPDGAEAMLEDNLVLIRRRPVEETGPLCRSA